jgi:radical SAM family protein/B12 binding protein
MRLTLAAVHTRPSPQAVPLANAFLASYLAADPLLADQVTAAICDLYITQPVAAGVAAIVATEPQAVGFSLYLWNRAWCRAVAAELRRRLPGLAVFAGGPEATADPAGVLAADGYDFLIVGEGETPLRTVASHLLRGEPLSPIPGVATLRDGSLQLTPAPPLAELDAIPSPLLSGLLPSASYSGFLWQLARGCDFGCDFCFDAQERRGVRRFSLARVEAELDWLVRHQVTQVFVLDSTFNQDMKRAKEILRLIGRTAPHIHFHFEVRHEFLDAELAELFAATTCSLQIGLQSSDPRVLKEVRRIFNPKDFSDKIMLLNESGAVFGFDLIYGLPGDTLAGFRQSLDFALALYPNHLDIFPLAILPGTALAGRSDALGLQRLTDPPYTLLGSPSFPPAAMTKAGHLAAACDIFYSRGKAVAWFNTVLHALKRKPSVFLADFWRWLTGRLGPAVAEAELTDREIWQLQRAFLEGLFPARGQADLLPLALDLVDYHYHFATALLATPPELPTDRDLAHLPLLELAWKLSPAAQLATFHYEVYELLETGVPDLREFADCFAPTGSRAVIYPRAGEIFTESLIEPYFLLLQRLDGTTPARQAADLQIPPEEVASFLEFAAAEGIVVRP